MNLISHKYNFAKLNLKNKTFISFCINLLIGILFSFPVFSAQSNVNLINLSKCECSIIDNESCLNSISDNISNPAIAFPEQTIKKVSGSELSKKNYIPGNKHNSQLNFSPPGTKEQLIPDLTQNCSNLHTTFVNLTYLKELRTTKMLC